MISMTKYTSTKKNPDNRICVNGAEFVVDDKTARDIMGLIEKSMNQPSTKAKSEPKEKGCYKCDGVYVYASGMVTSKQRWRVNQEIGDKKITKGKKYDELKANDTYTEVYKFSSEKSAKEWVDAHNKAIEEYKKNNNK